MFAIMHPSQLPQSDNMYLNFSSLQGGRLEENEMPETRNGHKGGRMFHLSLDEDMNLRELKKANIS